jgi:hypothetical protein
LPFAVSVEADEDADAPETGDEAVKGASGHAEAERAYRGSSATSMPNRRWPSGDVSEADCAIEEKYQAMW